MLSQKKLRFAVGISTVLWALVLRPAQAEENTPSAPPTQAEAAVAEPTETATNDPLTELGAFLDQNPNTEARLRENTALIGDPAFLKNHRQFAEFLDQHPQARADLAAQPCWFLHREFVRQSTPPVTGEQIAEFDKFLDQHPELAKQLTQDPQLLSQKEFFNRTPALQDYVGRHPEIHRTVTVLKPLPLLKRTTSPVLPVKRLDVPKVRIKGKP